MRPLKFRIWDGNNKHYVYPDVLELNAGLEYQQFTGLLDKQGKEIYEGDILKYKRENEWDMKPERAVCYFDNGGFWARAKPHSLLYHLTDFEVIGNVWENPELLKGE